MKKEDVRFICIDDSIIVEIIVDNKDALWHSFYWVN